MADKKTSKKRAVSKKKTSTKTKTTNKHEDLKLFVSLLAVIAALMVPVALFGTDGTANSAKQVLRSIQNGDCEEVYNEQVTESFRENVSEDNWLSGCSRIGPVLSGKPELFDSVKQDGAVPTVANVRYLVKGTDSRTYQVTVVVTKEGGMWKMLNFDSFVANQA